MGGWLDVCTPETTKHSSAPFPRGTHVRLLEALMLGLTQGMTEFLPVSSSAHLRLVPEILGWSDPGASFTAIVQLGTTVAVLLAFRDDLQAVTSAGWRGVRYPEARDDPQWRLALWLVVGTVPIAAVGIGARGLVDGSLRSLSVIAVALLLGSAWLWSAISRQAGTRTIESLSTRDAALIGVAQASALVPGVSRSAATITAGVHLGLDWVAAARFSFLLSVPAIVLAGLFGLRDLGDGVPIVMTMVATTVAFLSGYLSIRWLLRLVATGRLGWFVVYRCTTAAIVFVLLLER